MKQPVYPLKVFYDGACSVCSAEIEHYLRQNHGGKLIAIDISAPDFDPLPYQIPLAAFMYELHAIDREGEIYRGVEAFQAIWLAFPAVTLYRIMAAVIGLPLVDPVARLFYKGFARMRPFLPKRHTCVDGSCRIDRQ